ncbi:MAG: sigma factor-like helix-turn-helix DNA-binding protein, partial [Candidatus Bathyarchaeia archaeon]
MARQPDPAVEELDRRIVALRDKGLSYKEIAEQLGIPVSRCRLAARRDHYRKYLREYLKEYRRRHPEFYERLKRMVTERCRLRLRTDPEFRSKRNRYAREYRSTIFGDK